jgi:Family of unknown function (DUF5362)
MIYDSPGTAQAGVAVTAATIEYLRRAKPWVRFLAVMAFIGSAFLVVAGIGLALLGGALPMLSGSRGSALGGAFTGGALGAVYLLLALLYIFPGLYLWRYADAIGSLVTNPQSLTLEDAMKHQTAFFRFIGILTAVMLALYAVMLCFFVLFGAMSAFH